MLPNNTAQHVLWKAAHAPRHLNTSARAGVMSTAAGNCLSAGGVKLEPILLLAMPGPGLIPHWEPVLRAWQTGCTDGQVRQ